MKMLRYKKRIRQLANTIDIYISKDGTRIRNPKTIDILKDNGHNCYREQACPCSCIFCQPNKYNRAKEKRNHPIIVTSHH